MGQITIDKNVPLLPRAGKYPWADLGVGDSFLIERETGEPAAASHRHCSGLYARAKSLGMKITIRSVEGGIRVWRIE